MCMPLEDVSARTSTSSVDESMTSPRFQSQGNLGSKDSGVAIVRESRAMVWEWIRERGPVASWSAVLANEFAGQNGTAGELAQEWRCHADVGNAILKDLYGVVDSRLPEEDNVLRDMLRQVLDLISNVQGGVAAIQAHLAIFDM